MRIVNFTTKITIGTKGKDGYERPRVAGRVRHFDNVTEFDQYMSQKQGESAIDWINAGRTAQAKAAKRLQAVASENDRLGIEPMARRIEDTARFVKIDGDEDETVI